MPENQLSRKERSAQKRLERKQQELKQQQVDELRRNLIVGSALLGVSLFTGFAIWETLLGRTTNQTGQLREKIEELDHQLTSKARLEQFAPEIGHLAINYFSGHLGYSPAEFDHAINFLGEEDFRKVSAGECLDQTPGIKPAFNNPLLRKIYFNLSFFQQHPRIGLPWQFPATLMFGMAIHELHHNKAPLITLDTPEVIRRIDTQEETTIRFNQGLRGFALKPGETLSADACPQPFRGNLDEAIIEDSTESMLRKAGLNSEFYMSGSGYRDAIDTYRSLVLIPLFNGNNYHLLQFHQTTQRRMFFELIGERLNYPPSQRYIRAHDYLFPGLEVIRG